MRPRQVETLTTAGAAEDAVQDAFVSLHRHWFSLRDVNRARGDQPLLAAETAELLGMNPIETRLTEGLRTFAEGATMDVLDTERAHRDLFERITEDRTRRHRTLSLAAVAALVVGLLSVAGVQLLTDRPPDPAGQSVPLTRGNLAGIWLSLGPEDPGTMWWFDSQGRLAIDGAGHVDKRPAARGDYAVSQDSLTMTEVGGPQCETSWRARLLSAGHLQIVLTEAGPPCWLEDGYTDDLIRVVPASPESLDHLARVSAKDTTVIGDIYDVEGFWVRPGTGEALRFTTWAGYAFLGEAPTGSGATDEGTLTMTPDGRVVLTSSRDSHDCVDGDVLVLDDVRFSEDWTVMRATVVQDGCGRQSTGMLTWVRLSP